MYIWIQNQQMKSSRNGKPWKNTLKSQSNQQWPTNTIQHAQHLLSFQLPCATVCWKFSFFHVCLQPSRPRSKGPFIGLDGWLFGSSLVNWWLYNWFGLVVNCWLAWWFGIWIGVPPKESNPFHFGGFQESKPPGLLETKHTHLRIESDAPSPWKRHVYIILEKISWSCLPPKKR